MDITAFNFKAGTIEQYNDQKWGLHPVFIPQPVPDILLDKEMILLLTNAIAKLNELAGVGRITAHPELLILNYLRKEAVASARIEGTRITLSRQSIWAPRIKKLSSDVSMT